MRPYAKNDSLFCLTFRCSFHDIQCDYLYETTPPTLWCDYSLTFLINFHQHDQQSFDLYQKKIFLSTTKQIIESGDLFFIYLLYFIKWQNPCAIRNQSNFSRSIHSKGLCQNEFKNVIVVTVFWRATALIYRKTGKHLWRSVALFWRMRQELPELVKEAVLQKKSPKGGFIILYFIQEIMKHFTETPQKLQKLG